MMALMQCRRLEMYISQVEVDKDNRQKIRDLTHLGAFHNWVERSFPEEIEQSERTRKLWRIDQLRGKQYLLVVSPNQPDLETLENYGVVGSAKTKPYNNFLNRLENGMTVRFKATLNPVISLYQGPDQRGRVVPCLSEADQIQYLIDRSEKNGFVLAPEDFIITDKGFETLKKSGKKDIKINKVTYEGVLTISDEDIFRTTLKEGIGKKKAYGCGMMTVIPGV